MGAGNRIHGGRAALIPKFTPGKGPEAREVIRKHVEH